MEKRTDRFSDACSIFEAPSSLEPSASLLNSCNRLQSACAKYLFRSEVDRPIETKPARDLGE